MLEQLIPILLAQTGITPDQIITLYNRVTSAMDMLEEMDARLLRIEEGLLDSKVMK